MAADPRRWPGVLRSKGFFWIASRPDWLYQWSQAGRYCSFSATGRWWAAVPEEDWPDDAESREEILRDWELGYGDRRQEMVFIGAGMDREGLERLLEGCLLTDSETLQGPAAWAAFEDPFPMLAADADVETDLAEEPVPLH